MQDTCTRNNQTSQEGCEMQEQQGNGELPVDTDLTEIRRERTMGDLEALGRYGMPDSKTMRMSDAANLPAGDPQDAVDSGVVIVEDLAVRENEPVMGDFQSKDWDKDRDYPDMDTRPADAVNIDEEEMSDSGACCHDSSEPTFTPEELAGIAADAEKTPLEREHPYNEGTTVETEVMHAEHPGYTCAEYQAMISPAVVNNPDGVVILDPGSEEANLLGALLSGMGLDEPKRKEALKELREKVLSKAAEMREESQKVHAALTDIIPGSAYGRKSESSLGISAYWTWTTKAGVFSVNLTPAHMANPLSVTFEAVFGEGTPLGRSMSTKAEFRAPEIAEDLYGSLLNLITSLGGHP